MLSLSTKLVSVNNFSIPRDTSVLRKRWSNNLQASTQHLMWYYGWFVSASFFLFGLYVILLFDHPYKARLTGFGFMATLGLILLGARGLQVYLKQGGRGWESRAQSDILFGTFILWPYLIIIGVLCSFFTESFVPVLYVASISGLGV
jgi:hypothetical protein